MEILFTIFVDISIVGILVHSELRLHIKILGKCKIILVLSGVVVFECGLIKFLFKKITFPYVGLSLRGKCWLSEESERVALVVDVRKEADQS